MTLRFISDLHLDETRPDTVRAFFHYLDHLPADTEALYILGDFFEVWVGDDDDAEFHRHIKDKLKEKTAQGLPIFFMHGNRDFLVGKGFELYTGCMLINDPHVIEYQGQQYLLMHGDSLCTEDQEYQAFRQQMRDPNTQAMLLSKSLEERREIAAQLRANSKESNSNKAEDIMDVTPAEVERIMAEHNISTLIHGHTHRPAVHKLAENRLRYVLGDWHTSAWEIIIEDQTAELIAWPIAGPN